MEEEFIGLIKQLLGCTNDVEVNQVLSSNQKLVVPGLLPVMAEAAEILSSNNNLKQASFLLSTLLPVGELLGTTRKDTADVLLRLGTRWFDISFFDLALQCYQLALTIYQDIKNREGEASSLLNLGAAYHSRSQYQEALAYNQQCLKIKQEIKDSEGEARVWGNLGNAYYSLGRYKMAIDCYKKSLAIKRKTKDIQGKSISLGNLGNAYRSLGQYQRAIDCSKKSLAIARKTKDIQGESASLGNLGLAYYCLGQYQRAIDFQQKSLDIKREIKDRQGEANALGSLGIAYRSLGQYERAIDFQQKSLDIKREIKDRQGEAKSLGNLGNIYHSLEKYKRAIKFFERQLEIVREIKDRQGEAVSQGNLGLTYNFLGQHEQAIKSLQKCLKIAQEIKDRQGEATSLGNLGFAYYSQGKYEEAIDFYQQSLVITRKIKDHSATVIFLRNLGNVYYYQGQYKDAIARFRQALKIATPKTMPVECASVAGNLGNLYFTQNNWQKAIAAYTQAIEATEILRTGRQTDNSRQEILKNAINVYVNIIQSFVNTGQYAQAFTYAEQSRNRQLVDLMYSKDVYDRGETSSDVVELLQQYEGIQRQLDNLRSNNESLNYNRETVGAANPRQIRASWQARDDRIIDLEAKKQEIYAKIRDEDPVLAEGLAVKPLEFDRLQNLVKDSATAAIVSFFSTEEDTYAFILFGERVDLHRCGQGRNELQRWLFENWFQAYVWSGLRKSDRPSPAIMAAAKLLGCDVGAIASVEAKTQPVAIFLKDGSRQSADKAEFNKLRRQLAYIYDWQGQMPSNLKEISQRLQLDKLVEKLTGIQELIIVPHLYLHQIPFAALPLADNQNLGDKFLIRTQSSCQTLDFCTQRKPLSTEPSAFGIVEDTRGDLPCSSFEAQQVAKIYDVPADKYLQGTAATVGTYKELLEQVQGLLSSHHAESRLDNSLESALKLADGDITLSDLLSPALRFPNLDEIFLSCCETNLGTTEITDDTMTLNTGFLCAGARGAISSLWAVDDLATSLFSLYYHQQRKAGKNRPQALQKAQQDLRQLTGQEFAVKYSGEFQRMLDEKLQLTSQKKAEAKQKLDACAEDAAEYRELESEYQKREKLEERILKARKRLEAVCQLEHPFEHPEDWSGFICAGLR